MLTVYEIDAAGANRRIEYFAPEQFDAALARFDELAAEPVESRTPEVVNASSGAVERLWSAAAVQRFDEVATMLAPDVERVDHRAGVALAPITGVAAYLELLRASFARGEVERVAVTPLAVRGDRLSLTQVVVHVQDFEIAVVMVAELDGAGRVAFVSIYEAEDLATAQDELDGRFVAGEAAQYVAIMTTARSFAAASDANDQAAVAELCAPGVRLSDHRRFGLEDAWHYMGYTSKKDDLTGSNLVSKYLLGPGTLLASVVLRGVAAHGGEMVWLLHIVSAFDHEARYQSTDWYDAEDWDAALARFDELRRGVDA